LKSPNSTGAIAPSSRFVANSVVSLANLESAKTVVELGPGTGVFTEQIFNRLNPDSTFFALELNDAFVQATRDRCPQAEVFHDTAMSIGHYLSMYDAEQCDCIISSLPWTIFEPADQDRLLQTLSSVLAPGGRFVSIVYLGANTRRRGRHFIQSLPSHFLTVYKTKTVWQNMPPTQIYRCGN
jgi:phospholipid N-methyltransferase